MQTDNCLCCSFVFTNNETVLLQHRCRDSVSLPLFHPFLVRCFLVVTASKFDAGICKQLRCVDLISEFGKSACKCVYIIKKTAYLISVSTAGEFLHLQYYAQWMQKRSNAQILLPCCIFTVINTTADYHMYPNIHILTPRRSCQS